MKLLPIVAILGFALFACVIPGQSLYTNDPLTGGVDSRQSALLHIPLPSGLQYYPSHSKLSGGARKEGLETFRGYMDEGQAASYIYKGLRNAGWQMRLRESAGGRSIYIYEKDGELAAITFQKQGMLTIVHIWAGPRLADNAQFSSSQPESGDGLMSLPGETYAPAESQGQPGKVESWGVEERDL